MFALYVVPRVRRAPWRRRANAVLMKRVFVIVLRYLDTNQLTYSTLSGINMSGVLRLVARNVAGSIKCCSGFKCSHDLLFKTGALLERFSPVFAGPTSPLRVLSADRPATKSWRSTDYPNSSATSRTPRSTVPRSQLRG